MTASDRLLSASEAARRLGLSVKALRLYERRGLIAPARTAAGWRAYGPDAMARAGEIAGLRALGLGLAEIGRVLAGDAEEVAEALAAHQAALQARIAALASAVGKVSDLRSRLVPGEGAGARERAFLPPRAALGTAFDLPWPWGGERFELPELRPLTYITGPLGCGKTRLAARLAQSLPGAAFLGLDRSADGGAAARARLQADRALAARVARTAARLMENGATASDALSALLAGLEAEGPAALVVDMVEQGLDGRTQAALIVHLRRRGPGARPVLVLTRSRAILDLASVGPDETIIFCPANHSPPTAVIPCPGAPGYESVLSCLASPEVRARTQGMVAWRPVEASLSPV